MKINSIISNISNKVQIQKMNRLEAVAKKHLQVHGNVINDDTLREIVNARITIGNFAKKNNVKVDIYNGSYILDDLCSIVEENKVANKLFVTVTDLSDNKQLQALVPSFTFDTYVNEKTGFIVVNKNNEAKKIYRYIESSHEDTFVRNLFRTIDKLTGDLKGKKAK